MRIDDLFALAAIDTDDCTIWPYGKAGNRYGQVWDGKQERRCHRIVCELHHGAPFEDAEAAHSCGIPPCVNPKHLRWATRTENQADRILHGTTNRGERCSNANLTQEQVIEIRAMHNGFRKRPYMQEIAVLYSTTEQNVSHILNHKSWRYI